MQSQPFKVGIVTSPYLRSPVTVAISNCEQIDLEIVSVHYLPLQCYKTPGRLFLLNDPFSVSEVSSPSDRSANGQLQRKPSFNNLILQNK